MSKAGCVSNSSCGLGAQFTEEINPTTKSMNNIFLIIIFFSNIFYRITADAFLELKFIEHDASAFIHFFCHVLSATNIETNTLGAMEKIKHRISSLSNLKKFP
jgi:hypothetical protein